MPNSDISRLAEEAIALAQRAADPAVRANLTRAAETLKRVAEDTAGQRNEPASDLAAGSDQAIAAETSPPLASP